MLKMLLLMRHAKSSWDDLTLTDHKRQLNARGRAASTHMGAVLSARGYAPDQIWASDSQRTVETAKRLIRVIPGAQGIRYFPEFYHASAEDVFAVCAKEVEPEGSLMLLGHNPGWTTLYEIYTGQYRHMPTGACLMLSRKTESSPWYDPDNWRVRDFLTPKDVNSDVPSDGIL